MRLGLTARSICGAALASLIDVSGAQAMQFLTVPTGDPDQVIVEAVGEIIRGDFDRLLTRLNSLPARVQVIGFSLDSPGGNIIEAERIANGIRRSKAPVVVLGQAKCVSACFLIFAAAARKFAEPSALIGVHSASFGGTENATSMALTTAMARDAAEYGVPPGIIGKMVTTTPGQLEWLTQGDLISMGVKFLHNDSISSSASATPAGPPMAAEASPVFSQGLADRQQWERWYGALSGSYLDGASFWAAHRSDPKPPSCAGGFPEAFTTGCLAAQQRLALSDIRRKNDLDYRRGWNSY
jgi:hypothetical protein